jgi:hypothetical protein
VESLEVVTEHVVGGQVPHQRPARSVGARKLGAQELGAGGVRAVMLQQTRVGHQLQLVRGHTITDTQADTQAPQKGTQSYTRTHTIQPQQPQPPPPPPPSPPPPQQQQQQQPIRQESSTPSQHNPDSHTHSIPGCLQGALCSTPPPPPKSACGTQCDTCTGQQQRRKPVDGLAHPRGCRKSRHLTHCEAWRDHGLLAPYTVWTNQAQTTHSRTAHPGCPAPTLGVNNRLTTAANTSPPHTEHTGGPRIPTHVLYTMQAST